MLRPNALKMTVDDEQRIIGKLVNPAGVPYSFSTPENAEDGALFLIIDVCECSEVEAREHLQSLQDRKLVHRTMSQGGVVIEHDKPPKAQWGWAKGPSTD